MNSTIFRRSSIILNSLEPSQLLFVRLYCRKHDWINRKKIDYPEIKDVDGVLDSLVRLNILEFPALDTVQELDLLKLLTVKELSDFMSLTGVSCISSNVF